MRKPRYMERASRVLETWDNRWALLPGKEAGMSMSITAAMRRPRLVELEGSLRVDERVAEPARAMLSACRAAGLDPLVTSAYRSSSRQAWLLVRKVGAFLLQGRSPLRAWHLARSLVALPGTSEHELGVALDICSARGEVVAHAEVQAWLSENAWRFGFVQRYPSGKSHVTGFAHEPWHYRFVGPDAALDLRGSGLCLEEYLAGIRRLGFA